MWIKEPEKFIEAIANAKRLPSSYKYGIVEWDGQFAIINLLDKTGLDLRNNKWTNEWSKWYDIANNCFMTQVEFADIMLQKVRKL